MFMNYGQPQIIGALAQAKNYNDVHGISSKRTENYTRL